METIFKVGDKVYHCMFGWGEINHIYDGLLHISFKDSAEEFFPDGKFFNEDIQPTLSFTEYKLEGFSQERPIELPNKGEEIVVSNDAVNWKVLLFDFMHSDGGIMTYNKEGVQAGKYKYFKRLR